MIGWRAVGVAALCCAVLLMATPPNAQAQDRVIAPGDALQITVLGNSELTSVVVVSSDGHINYPFIQDVVVSGMSHDELESRLTFALSVYVTTAFVIVDYARFYTIKVHVLGQVTRPGFIEVPHESSIQGALAIAGDAAPDADLTQIRILRRGPDNTIVQRSVNLERALYEGGIAEMAGLKEGDMIIVPGAQDEDKIKLFGAINSPGSYVMPYGATVLDMVFLAGGATPDGTLSNVRRLRQVNGEPVEERLDLAKLLKIGRTDQIPKVERGEVIIVQGRLLPWRVVRGLLQDFLLLMTMRELYRRGG